MKKTCLLFFLVLVLPWTSIHAERVVGIHGFLASQRSMIPIAKYLRWAGFDVCLWEYPSRDFTIECHASHLVDLLKMIAADHPCEPIHFVAHSVGGVVLRAALNHPECPYEAKIGKAALLAVPNQGSTLGRQYQGNAFVEYLVGSGVGRQLMYYSPHDMEAIGCFPNSMQVLNITASRGIYGLFQVPNDGWVAVDDTYLDTPHYQLTLYLKHDQVLRNPYCLQTIRDFFVNPCINLPYGSRFVEAIH